MMRVWARITVLALAALGLASCAQTGGIRGLSGGNFERAESLVPDSASGTQSSILTPPRLPIDIDARTSRDDFTEYWMARSDLLCRRYKDKIIAASIDSRLTADLFSTVLSTLSTIFTPVNTVRGLAGAAAVATGIGAVVQTDAFQSQAGQILASAIQTARQNQANQIEINLKDPTYSIYKAQRDVIEYHNMCSMETALIQVQASLKATSPDAGMTPPAKQGKQTTGGINPELLIPKGESPVRPQPPPQRTVERPIVGAIPPIEPVLTLPEARRIEAALCLRPDTGTVTFGLSFRQQLALFRERRTGNRLTDADGLTADEASLLSATPACNRTIYANAFEYFMYPTPKDILDLQVKMLQPKAPSGKPVSPVDGTFGPGTRDAIKAIQEQRCQAPTGEVTRKFLDSLVDPPKPC
jgi:peptidoglycan hydrolase-like protein with peptidoglycan-binding domain